MSRHPLPESFLGKCTTAERQAVEAWWQRLSDNVQREVCVLLDRRNDLRAYVYAPNKTGHTGWHHLPISEEQLPPERLSEDEPDWQLDYCQFLTNHPQFDTGLTPVRMFQISGHPSG